MLNSNAYNYLHLNGFGEDSMRDQIKAFLISCIILILSGCASTPTYVDENDSASDDPALDINTVYFKQNQSFVSSPPSCIAVLPLALSESQQHEQQNATTKSILILSPENLQQLRWILYSHLAPFPFRDVELEQINKVVTSIPYSQKTVDDIGAALNCDTLLIGTITEYHSDFLGFYSQTAIGIELKLLRSIDGEVLWEARHVAKSHAGSIPITPVDLVVGLYSATENVSAQQVVHVADDLFRNIFATWNIPQEQSPKTHMAENEIFPLYVTAEQLYLRSGPGKKFKPMDVLNQNDKLALIDNKTLPWLRVKCADGQLGYVHQKFIAQLL
jgi:SH3 domain-containing protein